MDVLEEDELCNRLKKYVQRKALMLFACYIWLFSTNVLKTNHIMAKHPEKYKNYADNILFYISPHLIRQYFQGILHEVFMRLQLCFAYFTIVVSPIRECGHINQFTVI